MNLKIINLKFIIFLFYSAAIILLPYYSYDSFGDSSAILPASDICVLYYLCSYKNLNNIQLFFIGVLMDSVIGIPIGISSASLISARIALSYLGNLLSIKQYITNLSVFILYCSYIILARYFLVSFFVGYEVDLVVVGFLWLSTIASYPVLHYLMKLPDSLFTKKSSIASYP